MNELNNIWQDVQRGPPDPFLVLLINTDNLILFFIESIILEHYNAWKQNWQIDQWAFNAHVHSCIIKFC